ncbi:hypothetical protein [Nostoc linckia]|uniref:hypothetical protein n=1 Tax=Nostoc linckia TaxID=92942 RepID=UPI001A7E2A40|nr:hypothetical protein [Nostoc linckia]
MPCPYTWRYNLVPHLSGKRYKKVNVEVQRVKLKLSNVWVVEDFPVRLLCDRQLTFQSALVLDFRLQEGTIYFFI